MKYVIYKSETLYMPVIFPDHVTHSTVKIEEEGFKVFSAGFFTLEYGVVAVLPERSESLNIGPSNIDIDIIDRALKNSGTADFLDFNLF